MTASASSARWSAKRAWALPRRASAIAEPLRERAIEIVERVDRPVVLEELVAAVQVRLGEFRLQPDRRIVSGDGVPASAHRREENAPVEMSKRIGRTQLERPVECRERLIMAAELLKNDAAIAVGFGEARCALGGGLEGAKGVALPALLQIDVAEKVADDRMIGDRAPARLDGSDRLVIGTRRDVLHRGRDGARKRVFIHRGRSFRPGREKSPWLASCRKSRPRRPHRDDRSRSRSLDGG